ncbi:MAG: NAD(P)/FAD-dependent oxidoreductase, partial [Vicinamibacterales bacterium]
NRSILNSPHVVVLGGGPAGAAAAKLLAQWGHSVRLITRAPVDARMAVSIPPSAYKLFDAIGISDAIDRAGFIRSTGNTVWWGQPQPRVERFADGARGWQVPLQRLEEAMLAEAAAAGVTIERRVIVEGDLQAASGRFLIDATGRSGMLARAQGVRVYDEGPRTVALVASWTRTGAWPVPDDTHTLIESYESGWAWSVPTSPGTRSIAVMVDPQRSTRVRGASARDLYLSEIARTITFQRLTAGAQCTGDPRGWDASAYRAVCYFGDGWLLAGDAGSFIDPLSSAGVKKALASGWLAAVVVHTTLTKPAMQSHAMAFFSHREQEIERHYLRMSQSFLAEAAPTHPHAFWRDRADAPETPIALDAAVVRAAYERIRSAPVLRLAPGEATIDQHPVVRGNEIALAPGIVAGDESIRFVHGVDVVALRELAPRFSQVPDLFESYCRAHGEVPLHDFLMALATAVARRWLVAQ